MVNWFRMPGKLLSLPTSEIVDLVRAQRAILWAQLLVWVRPRGELLEIDEPGEHAKAGSEVRARQLDQAIRRVARFGLTRPKCLVRALALHRLLLAAGIRGSRVRIGVRVSDTGFAAHAWVVWGDAVLGDDVRNVDQFATLTDGRAAPG